MRSRSVAARSRTECVVRPDAERSWRGPQPHAPDARVLHRRPATCGTSLTPAPPAWSSIFHVHRNVTHSGQCRLHGACCCARISTRAGKGAPRRVTSRGTLLVHGVTAARHLVHVQRCARRAQGRARSGAASRTSRSRAPEHDERLPPAADAAAAPSRSAGTRYHWNSCSSRRIARAYDGNCEGAQYSSSSRARDARGIAIHEPMRPRHDSTGHEPRQHQDPRRSG